MKKFLVIACCAVALVGCASDVNKFLEAQPNITNEKEIVGNWSGNLGSDFLMSLKINDSGSGYYCMYHTAAQHKGRVIVSDKKVILESGAEFNLTIQNENKIKLSSFGGLSGGVLVRDSDLIKGSDFCTEYLKSK